MMENEQLLSQIAALIEQSEKWVLSKLSEVRHTVTKVDERTANLDEREQKHCESIVSAVGDVVETVGEQLQEMKETPPQTDQQGETLKELKRVVAQNTYDILTLKQRL